MALDAISSGSVRGNVYHRGSRGSRLRRLRCPPRSKCAKSDREDSGSGEIIVPPV